MATKYRTDYQILKWHSLADLQGLLNTLINDGWRVDNHKLSGDQDKSQSGWTIFSKTVVEKQELSSCEIPTRVVWDALNSAEFYKLFPNDDHRERVSNLISDRVKTFCKQWTDGYEYN